jgi:hypothetical protein
MRVFAVSLLGLMLLGCQQSGGANPGTAGSVGSEGITATPSPTDATLLRAGPPPMSYMLGSGGPVRIVDATTGKRLSRKTLAPQSIILVDAQKGVVVGTDTLVKGPLDPVHRYEIWLDKK